MALVRVFQKGDIAIAEWVGGGSEKENPSKKVGFRAASVHWSSTCSRRPRRTRASASTTRGASATSRSASFTFKGTQKGALGPIKPTNEPFALHGLEIDVFEDGKLQKATTYTNGVELAGQLGLLPKPKTDAKKDDKKPAAPAPKR